MSALALAAVLIVLLLVATRTRRRPVRTLQPSAAERLASWELRRGRHRAQQRLDDEIAQILRDIEAASDLSGKVRPLSCARASHPRANPAISFPQTPGSHSDRSTRSRQVASGHVYRRRP